MQRKMFVRRKSQCHSLSVHLKKRRRERDREKSKKTSKRGKRGKRETERERQTRKQAIGQIVGYPADLSLVNILTRFDCQRRNSLSIEN